MYGQIITSGELFVKAQYLCSMQVDTNWYWNQYPQNHVITVPTRTILHPLLEVNTVTYFYDRTKSLCNKTQEKIHIKTYHMFDLFWLRLNLRRNLSLGKIEFETDVEVYSDDKRN